MCVLTIYVRHFCSAVYGYDMTIKISRRNHPHSGIVKDALVTKRSTEETGKGHFIIRLRNSSPNSKQKDAGQEESIGTN
jgi:hypothetical protein